MFNFLKYLIIGTKSLSDASIIIFLILGQSIGVLIKSIIIKESTTFCLYINFPSIFNLWHRPSLIITSLVFSNFLINLSYLSFLFISSFNGGSLWNGGAV